MVLRALRNVALSTAAVFTGVAPAMNADQFAVAPNPKVAGTYDTAQDGMDCSPVEQVSRPVVAATKAPVVAKKAPAKKQAPAKIVEKRYPTYADWQKHLAEIAPKKPVTVAAHKKKIVVAAAKPTKTLAEVTSSTAAVVKYACTVRGGAGGGLLALTPSSDAPPVTVADATPTPAPQAPVADTPVAGGPTCPTDSFCGVVGGNVPYYPPIGGGGYYPPQPPVVIVTPPSWPGMPGGPGIPTLPITPAVPEPSTYALMGAGLAALALAARRRNAASPKA